MADDIATGWNRWAWFGSIFGCTIWMYLLVGEMLWNTNAYLHSTLAALMALTTTASGFLLWRWQKTLTISQATRLFLCVAFPATISLFALRDLAGENSYPLKQILWTVIPVFAILFVQFTFVGNYGPFSSIRRLITTFNTTDALVSDEGIQTKDDYWYINHMGNKKVFPLFIHKFQEPLQNCILIYEAQVKSRQVAKAYLEMWLSVEGNEFFSRGIQKPIRGDKDWQVFAIPFFLGKRQSADYVRLNIVSEGAGEIWIKDIHLYCRDAQQ